MRIATRVIAAVASALLTAGAHAAVITPIGSDGPMIDYRETDVAKAWDVDGDDTYGTDGYAFYLTAPWETTTSGNQVSLPAYVSGITDYTTTGLNNTGGAYGKGDDPTQTVDADIPGLYYGIRGFNSRTVGQTYSMFDFTLSSNPADIPDTFRIGVGVTGANIVPTAFTLNGVSIPVANSSYSQGMTFYFFDVDDASAGETLSLSGTAGWSAMYLNGFVFDQVPEPATMALIAIGGAGLLLRRRRS